MTNPANCARCGGAGQRVVSAARFRWRPKSANWSIRSSRNTLSPSATTRRRFSPWPNSVC